MRNEDMFDFRPFPSIGTRIYSEAEDNNKNDSEGKFKKYTYQQLVGLLTREEANMKVLKSKPRTDTVEEKIKEKQLHINKIKEEIASRTEYEAREPVSKKITKIAE